MIKQKSIIKICILTLVLSLIRTAMISAFDTNDYYPADTWRTSSPEAQGMDSDILYQVADSIQSEGYWIHSFLVIRHGYLVEEAYFFPYHKDDRHQLNSCTKSFTSALVGIALDKGYLKDVNQKVVDFFPEVNITNLDERKKNMDVENLLTMTSGLDWPEWDAPYGTLENVNTESWLSGDPVNFILNAPMKTNAGVEWHYNSGASHLLSAIVRKSSRMDELDFADKYLFHPLGITNYHWEQDPQKNLAGGGNLHLTPRDMAKFGYLYLRKGKWKKEQIVSEKWVNTSWTIHTKFETQFFGYGYQFWIPSFGGYAAIGKNGQFIFILPEQDMVVVFTSGLPSSSANQNDFIPMTLMRDVVLESVKSDHALPGKAKTFYSDHQKLLKKMEWKAPKNYTWQVKDL